MISKKIGWILFIAGIAGILFNILAIFFGSFQGLNVVSAFVGLIAVIVGWKYSHPASKAN